MAQMKKSAPATPETKYPSERAGPGPGDLSAVRSNLGPRTWAALREALMDSEYLCDSGRSYLRDSLAEFEEGGGKALELESIKRLMPLMQCFMLRSSVLKGIARHTANPEVLAFLSGLDSAYYLPTYENHKLREAVARNPSTPAEILERYAGQTADVELREIAARLLSALRK